MHVQELATSFFAFVVKSVKESNRIPQKSAFCPRKMQRSDGIGAYARASNGLAWSWSVSWSVGHHSGLPWPPLVLSTAELLAGKADNAPCVRV